MNNIILLSFLIFLCAVFLWSVLQYLWAAGRKHRKNSARAFDSREKSKSGSGEGNHLKKVTLVKGIEISNIECLVLMI